MRFLIFWFLFLMPILVFGSNVKVHFSNEKFPCERSHAMKILLKDLEPLPPGLMSWPPEIGIFKYDLNSDGILDVLCYFVGSLLGGSGGNMTEVYLVDKQGRWRSVFSGCTVGEMDLYETKHRGLHDIAVLGLESRVRDIPTAHVYAWDGKRYKWIYSKRIKK